MRDVSEETLTDAVLATIVEDADPRFREIMNALIPHLHDFAKEVDLTKEEWLTAIEFLYQTGKKSSRKRNEFVLLSDTLGLSTLVDMISSRGGEGATEVSVLGPFYIENSPMIENGGDLIRDNPGEQGVVTGRVLSTDGKLIGSAMLDVWQNASNGLYSNEDPDQADDNLRGRLLTDADGTYCYTTTRPMPYTVPDDGPVGDMLRAMGRHPWRPAHIHFKVSADGYQDLITEIFPADDQYIDEDAVFGVRTSLAVDLKRNESSADATKFNISAPFFELAYDFVLRPV